MLLDECVDRRLAADVLGHDVKTVPEIGWAALTNGELLAQAEQEFDVFVTVRPQSSIPTRPVTLLHRRDCPARPIESPN